MRQCNYPDAESGDFDDSDDFDSQVNSNEIIIATTIYTCGPAALATVMKNIGVNATEEELASLAGTDETGTTMYGLAKAARAKGLNAVGAKLTIDQLGTSYIVVVSIMKNITTIL